jgi:hypothetical protein
MLCGGRGEFILAYFVEHHGCAEHVDTRVVGPLDVVQVRAIDSRVGSVEDLVRATDQADVHRPLVRLRRPLRVSLIASVSVQPRRDIEETALRNRVLVVVAVVESENLPPETTAASLVVPSRRLAVENCLCESQPAGLIVWRIRVADFGRCHGCHAPEGLVVVAERFGLVLGLVVEVGSALVEHGLCCDRVVFRRARIVPVVDQRAEHGAGFPPVVRVSEQAWDSGSGVSVVI